jgi:4-diphosphocytidyl-2-C-methyl-D-erythritol kinase
VKLKAFAKINLSLHVFGKRPDGYHALESVMQSVSLCDYIIINPAKEGLTVTCSDPRVPQGPANIAYKAAELFTRKQKAVSGKQLAGINIHIEKNIPMAAGLAGGSADAAAVLYGLNQMLDSAIRIPQSELLKLAAQVGSDVPFCLTGGTCLVEGRGEIVTPQEPWPKTYFVLATPDFPVSTKWAYEEFDRLNLSLPSTVKNDLEAVVLTKHEEIATIKERLIKLGCYDAQMSGSGPTVFGSVHHKAEAQKILEQIQNDYLQSFVTETVDRGVAIADYGMSESE